MFTINTQSLQREQLKSLKLGLFCLFFVVLIIGCLNLRYMVNDNTGIIEFITGGYPIPYVGILLSSLLHQAYSVAPAVPWFALTLYALQTFSLFLWLMLVWRVFRTRWQAVACTLVVLGYYLDFIVSLDFTATSIMLCTVSLAWACTLVMERHPRMLPLLGIVFAVGMMVRPQGATGSLIYMLPLAAITAITCIRGRSFVPEARRLVLAASLFLLPAVLNLGVDTLWRDAIRTPQEAQYEAFNTAGGELLHLSPRRVYATTRVPGLLASVHWTVDDVVRLQRWQFLDERIYTPEALQTLWANAPLPVLDHVYLNRQILQRFPPYDTALPLLVAVLPLFLYLLWGFRTEGIIGLLLPIYCVGLTLFMCLMYAFGDRIELPLETGLGFAGLLMAGLLVERMGRAKDRRFLLAVGASLGIALTGMVFSVSSTLRDQPQLVTRASQVRHRLNGLNKNFPGSIILVQPNSLELNVLSPFEHVELNFQPINLGWNTFSPRFHQQISSLGIEHGYQLVDALVDRPNAYILGPEEWIKGVLIYASDSDRRHIQLVNVGTGLFRLTEDKKK